MFCSSCGTKLSDGSKFCSGCGIPVGVIHDTSDAVHQSLQVRNDIYTPHYGNLANNSLMVKYNGTTYLKTAVDGKKVFAYMSDDGDGMTFEADWVSNIIPYGGIVYLLVDAFIDNGKLWTLEPGDTTCNHLFSSGKPKQFFILDDYIYYISSAQKKTLCRVDMKGNHNELLINLNIGYFAIYNDIIYFVNDSDKGRIYSAPLNSPSAIKKLSETRCSEAIQFTDDYIYFKESYRKALLYYTRLVRIRLEGGASETIIQNLDGFNIDGDTLFTVEGKDLVQYDNFEFGLNRDVLQKIDTSAMPSINICGDNIHICSTMNIFDRTPANIYKANR